MAELVDALDSGSSRGNSVDVRVILAAKTKIRRSEQLNAAQRVQTLRVHLQTSIE